MASIQPTPNINQRGLRPRPQRQGQGQQRQQQQQQQQQPVIQRNNRRPPRPRSKQELNNYLKRLYLSPKNPASYQGINKLYQAVKEDGRYSIFEDEVQEWLQQNIPYSLNRHVRKVKRWPKVLVSGIDDQFEADLADLSAPEYVAANRGVKYLLFMIDVFSRYLWVEPLKNKLAQTVINAFKKIFRQTPRRPRRLRSDAGTEFTAAATKNYMQQIDIAQVFTHNDRQANYVERVIKTIKNKLKRHMRKKKTDRYIDVLPDIVKSYNNTWHHGIQQKPKNVNKKNERRLWWEMYWFNEPYDPQKTPQMRRPVKHKFKVGDFVRITLRRPAFAREYGQRWTNEYFTIFKLFTRQRIPMYRIKDLKGEEILGTFYQNELQKIIPEPGKMFLIKDIIDEKNENGRRMVKVSYQGWPKKFNTWMTLREYNTAIRQQ